MLLTFGWRRRNTRGTDPDARPDQRAPEPVGQSATLVFGARLVSAGTNWVGSVVIARELAPQAFGGYSFVFGLLGIIGLVVDLQVGRVVIRDILDADDADAGRVAGSYVALRSAIALVAYAVAVIVVLTGDYNHEIVIGTVVGGFSFLFVAPANGVAIWFQARLWMRPTAAIIVLSSAFQLVLVLGFAATHEGSIVAFAAAITVGELVGSAWRIWSLRRYGLRIRLTLDTARWAHWLKDSIPLAIGFGLISIYYKVDIVLLSQFDSLSAVGQYSVGYKFADIVGYLPFALLTPVMTLMITSWPDHVVDLRLHFRRAWVLLALVGAACAVGFALVAAPVIRLLYGTDYGPATGAARLLVAGVAIQFFSYLCFTTLASIGRTRAYALGGLVGLIINIALNLALIPDHSFDGSAVATVLTEIVVLAFLLGALSRTAGIVSIPWSSMLRSALAAAAMAGVYLALETVTTWWVAMIVAGATFLFLVDRLSTEGGGGLRGLWTMARFELGDDELDQPMPSDR